MTAVGDLKSISTSLESSFPGLSQWQRTTDIGLTIHFYFIYGDIISAYQTYIIIYDSIYIIIQFIFIIFLNFIFIDFFWLSVEVASMSKQDKQANRNESLKSPELRNGLFIFFLSLSHSFLIAAIHHHIPFCVNTTPVRSHLQKQIQHNAYLQLQTFHLSIFPYSVTTIT